MSVGTRLFVGNLPDHVNDNELKKAFSSFGEVLNLDMKKKSGIEDTKNFAFVTLSGTNYDLESCIKHFSNVEFSGSKLYVTRARESFLERLQRERIEAKNDTEKIHNLPKKQPVIKLGDKLNPRKRQINHIDSTEIKQNNQKPYNKCNPNRIPKLELHSGDGVKKPLGAPETSQKKQDADKKRLESMNKKRQEFKQKQMIIKSGLVGVDKTPNKKVIFSEDDTPHQKTTYVNGTPTNMNAPPSGKKSNLFDDEDSGDEVNFEIKKQFEGKKGQKVLDLQSRYKSDKRFVLDERFIDDNESEDEKDKDQSIVDDNIEIGQTDEKIKQMNILQDVLGISIKSRISNPNAPSNTKKGKSKLGMLRYDPTQPEHAKFLAPVEEKQEIIKKQKKKKSQEKQEVKPKPEIPEPPKIEVSKDQFYKISDTLKEAITQPVSFSLRSLFGNNEEDDAEKDESQQDSGYIPLENKKTPKVKNPLEPADKNPFIYDTSESETEELEDKIEKPLLIEGTEPKTVWRENLFFSDDDYRLKEGLTFFNMASENKVQKERRELKALMKKRIYNKERKNQMFRKKIGGRKKMMKKSFRKTR